MGFMGSERMSEYDPVPRLLEIHKTTSEELRHTATTIWQFSIAIVTLQGGAVALSGNKDFNSDLGKWVLAVGFLLSVCFSVMLVRQARERSGFVKRIYASRGRSETESSETLSRDSISVLLVHIISACVDHSCRIAHRHRNLLS